MLLLRRSRPKGLPYPLHAARSLASSSELTPSGKEGHYDTFLAGLVGGYLVFGRTVDSSVTQQIVIYVFARVALAWAGLALQPHGETSSAISGGKVPGSGGGFGLLDGRPVLREKVTRHAWTAFASLSWAAVMYMFRWHPETLQPSLYSSMHYIYESSDHWDSFRNFLIHNK